MNSDSAIHGDYLFNSHWIAIVKASQTPRNKSSAGFEAPRLARRRNIELVWLIECTTPGSEVCVCRSRTKALVSSLSFFRWQELTNNS